jgi:hypothetical protein
VTATETASWGDGDKSVKVVLTWCVQREKPEWKWPTHVQGPPRRPLHSGRTSYRWKRTSSFLWEGIAKWRNEEDLTKSAPVNSARHFTTFSRDPPDSSLDVER